MKKTITFILIFVIIFNFINLNIVEADLEDNIKYAFYSFIVALNAYNVYTFSINSLEKLFNSFYDSMDSMERNEFVNSLKYAVGSNGIINIHMLYGINSWIREMFKKGFNTKEIPYNPIVDDIQLTESEFRKVKEKRFDIRETRIGSFYINGYGAYVNVGIQPSKCTISYSNGEYHTMNGAPDPPLYGNEWYITIQLRTESDGNDYVRVYVSNTVAQKAIYIPYRGSIDHTTYDKVNYYAGEAVDYPMEKEVDDRPLSLPIPLPSHGIPGVTQDGNNVVFDGTIDQFLDAIKDNIDYLDYAIDKVIDNAQSISHPIVDTVADTITWPATDVIDYPVPGIDYPDTTIPDSVESGIGETNSILQGIGSFIESIFAEPSVELDLLPLSNVNLKEKFPFCLPFDLSRLITGLESNDKQAPEIDFKFKVYNEEYSIPINFEIFNNIAIIVNWFVLIIFIIGLILISRKLIGG